MKHYGKKIGSSIAALGLLLTFAWPSVASAVVSTQSLAAPVYQGPAQGTFWKDVTNAGPGSVPFAVGNLNNGPGTKTDPAYLTAFNNANAAGIHVLGYVQTNYQARPFKSAYSDIDTWYRLYPNTKGIFVDSITQDNADDLCYVAALYSHVKNVHPNDLFVLNPGSHVKPTYEPYADIFLTSESDYATYQNWQIQYKGFEDNVNYQNRFWHSIYGVSQDNYNNAFTQARNNNAGWVFITDKTAPTPYTSTPSYWQNEISDVNAVPDSAIPNRGKTTLPRGCISLNDSANNTIDTTVPKQTTVLSDITVNNSSTIYDSEPTTTLAFASLPTGVTVTNIGGSGWTCDANKTCAYGAILPAGHAVSATATLIADCTYTSGSALLRLTNYAGNRWDNNIPIHAPVGCDPTTPAGVSNAKGTGQVATLTTQSTETTPAIPVPGTSASSAATPTQKKAVASKSSYWSGMRLAALAVIIADLIFLIVWGIFKWRELNNPYRIR